jgi:hypothetical protein
MKPHNRTGNLENIANGDTSMKLSGNHQNGRHINLTYIKAHSFKVFCTDIKFTLKHVLSFSFSKT